MVAPSFTTVSTEYITRYRTLHKSLVSFRSMILLNYFQTTLTIKRRFSPSRGTYGDNTSFRLLFYSVVCLLGEGGIMRG